MKYEIKPELGLGDLSFGFTMSQVSAIIGPEDETEVLDNDDAKAILWHYHELAITCFFESGQLPRLSSFEIMNDEATLWGKKVFDLNEKDIIALLNENGYMDLDREEHEWGETRVSCDEIGLDFYFQDDELISVNFGIILDSSDTLNYSLN